MDRPSTAHNEHEEDLKWRLSQLTPQDTVRGVFLKGIVEVVRELGDEASVRQCLDVVGEQKLVDFFSYPSDRHIRMIYTAARLLSDRFGGFEHALRAMGHQGTKNFLSSAVGKLMLVVGQGNPQRLINGLPPAFSVAVSSLTSEVKWTSPQSATFILRRDFVPLAYTEGALRAVLENAKVKRFEIRPRQPEPLVGEYDLSWE